MLSLEGHDSGDSEGSHIFHFRNCYLLTNLAFRTTDHRLCASQANTGPLDNLRLPGSPLFYGKGGVRSSKGRKGKVMLFLHFQTAESGAIKQRERSGRRGKGGGRQEEGRRNGGSVLKAS